MDEDHASQSQSGSSSSEEVDILELELDGLELLELPPPGAPPIRAAPAQGRRSDIQCLRALAVLMVIFFHLDLPGQMGGFVGVDIFFVISGYLVGGRIIRDKIAETWSFPDFVRRRLHRLFLPSVACLVIVMICLASLGLKIGWDVASASVYGANIFFFVDQTSYFKSDMTSSFVLHFWSLAVEEQIYIFFPLVLYLYFWGNHSLLSSTIFVIPLTIASFVTIFFVPQAAKFFLPSSRLWEFLLGTMVNMYEEPLRKYFSHVEFLKSTPAFYTIEAIKWICVASLIICSVFYSSDDWPNSLAIPPVIATCIIIFINTPINIAPLEYIGDLSYSLYLFHWPLVRVASIIWFKIEAPPPVVWYYVAFLAFTTVISVASYYLIEKPTASYLHCRPVFWFFGALAGTVLIFGVGVLAVFFFNPGPIEPIDNGTGPIIPPFTPFLPSPVPVAPPTQNGTETNTSVPLVQPPPCFVETGSDQQNAAALRASAQACASNGPMSDRSNGGQVYDFPIKTPNPDLCIYATGDSHLRHYNPGLSLLAAELGVPKERMWFDGRSTYLHLMMNNPTLTSVTGWFTSPVQFPPEFLNCKERMIIWSAVTGVYNFLTPSKAEFFINEITTLLTQFSKIGCTVYIGDTPNWNMMNHNDLANFGPCATCLRNLPADNKCGGTRDLALGGYQGLSFPRHQIPIFKDNLNVTVVLMEDHLCDSNNWCPATYNNRSIYWDGHHFTKRFSEMFAPTFVQQILSQGCSSRLFDSHVKNH